MTNLMIDCPQCNGDGFISFGDRHVENAKEVCSTCNGHGQIPARTGETPETSAPYLTADKFTPVAGTGPIGPLTLAPLDPVVEAVRADLLRRSQFGLRKYGTPLSRTDLDLRAWLNHAYEEALDFANYLKRSIMELGGEDVTAPAPASPGVPDSLRALSEAYRGCEAICAQMDADLPDSAEVYVVGARRSLCTYGDIRRAVEGTTHPARQSAGSGADGWREEYLVGRRDYWQNEAQRLAALVRKLGGDPDAKPAPDSTRTGDEGTEELPGEPTPEMEKAFVEAYWRRMNELSFPETPSVADQCESAFRPAYRAMIAARPAAPEAQGAWRERAATEIDAIGHQWRLEGDANGQAYAKTLAAIIRAEAFAPLASSGQGVR